jgi:hypothetical protein
MPRGDRNGPFGLGPRTGRGAGYCAGYSAPGFMNFVPGRGFFAGGRGPGGRGWRNWFYATGLTGWQRARWGWPLAQWPSAGLVRDQELNSLKGQAEYLEDALDGIRKRIEDLEAKSPTE